MPASPARSVLLVDDDDLFLDATATILRAHGFIVGKARNLEEALALGPERYDTAVLDHHLPDGEGIGLASQLAQSRVRLILISGAPPIEAALAAIRLGVTAFLVKPLDMAELLRLLGPSKPTRDGLLPSMQERRKVLEAVASARCPVLITGETGVGKGFLARLIHDMGPKGRFVELNCAAIPQNLVEAELFGVERGAFTGAETRPGLIEEADGGTLFLDELGELSVAMQAKLLTFLDNNLVRRVGGLQSRRVDVRVIAATNVDVDSRSDDRGIRLDLLHRLDVARFALPPLRERPEDLEDLVERILRRMSARDRKHYALAEGELSRLKQHAWPGNVRELQNALERTTLDGRVDALAPSATLRGTVPGARQNALPPSSTLGEIERDHVLRVLREHQGNRTHAAKTLGMGLSTLRRKLKGWGVEA